MTLRLPFSLSSQRLRLAAITTAFSGLLVGAVFFTASIQFRRAERNSSYEILKPAAELAIRVYRERPKDPDWFDVLDPNPDLSIAVFDRNGKFLDALGPLKMRPLEGRGLSAFNGVQATYLGRRTSEGWLVVVASPWDAKQRAINRFNQYLIWFYVPVIMAAGLVTWLASRSTFRPLASLAEQAERLSYTDLTRRLELKGADEYAEFATHLNRFLELLEASVQRQERFVADAAHELRTPLTVIRGQIETTLLRARSPEDYREALVIALTEAERLSRLVDGLLLSASVPVAVPPKLELSSAIESAQARWVDRFSKVGVGLVIGELTEAAAEMRAEECDSILDNLLSNALKHSEHGSKTTLTLAVADDRAEMSVADEGGGIPEEFRDKLFERFARVETSRNRGLGGFGIGLSVVKRLVEARGGSVRLKESPVGAHFVVSLPLARVEG